MKRSLVVTLIVGAVTTAIICLLQAKGLFLFAEKAIDGFASRHASLTKQIAAPWQYVFVALLSFGMAWVTIASKRVGWVRWIVAVLLIELFVAPWVFAIYHVFFQPLPSMLAVVLGFGLGLGGRIAGPRQPGAKNRRAVLGPFVTGTTRPPGRP